MTVVHSKPTDPRLALRAQLAATDLRVEFHRHHQHAYIGTRAQLEAENMAPPDGRWPNGSGGRHWIRWVDSGMRFTLSLEHASNLRKLYGSLPDEDHYRLRVEPAGHGLATVLQSQMLEKLDEMQEIRHRGTREHHETFMKRCAAQSDKWFQGRLSQIVSGAMPRKGGRPRVGTP